jgi:hypothetical protein
MTITKRDFFWILPFFWFFLTGGNSCCPAAQEKGGVFSTWEGFEADKCASIWLIKRFVDTGAIIKFFPKGEIITEGTPFDTPEAKLKRYHNMSTFETILKQYNLTDPRLIHLGEIIHDIEINIWERKRFEETASVRHAVNEVIQSAKSSAEVIEKTLSYLDGLYAGMGPGTGASSRTE